ncbi:hypothetical protein BDN72DRAFT_876816 [Pluteus cervinus]|uniref:Uncharacterized protein n=1 Tax=Pluteus cervinus TaxID=181527 RepID=A0ACD3B2W2_9AGAR|nr:hypothetical protein BDN72DRAFT_876816 [Pluteus cervinus]
MEFTRTQAFRTFLALPRSVNRKQRRRKNGKDDRNATEAELNADARKYVGCMPPDVMLEIVDHLSPIDILNFSLTSSYVRDILMPALYETVLLKSSRKCLTTLPLLLTRPEIARHVRKLAVRPNYYLAWPKPDEPIEEDWVANQIMLIAESGSLSMLHTFDWDGLEMPKDELWSTLQRCCPQLRTVFSNVGYKPLDPDSKLFDYKALTSFSLIVRHGLGGADLFPTLEKLPPRLWSMLFHSCPDLTELTLCSFSSSARLFDVHNVSQGRWPKLHTLTLGSFGYQADFSLTAPAGTPVGLGGAAFSLGSIPTITTTTTTTVPTTSGSSITPVVDASTASTGDAASSDVVATTATTSRPRPISTIGLPSSSASPASPTSPPPQPSWNPSDVHQHIHSYLTHITHHPQTTIPFDAGLPAEHAFAHFLMAHTTLTYLRLSWNFKRWMSPESIPMYLTGGVKVDVMVSVPPPVGAGTGTVSPVLPVVGLPMLTNTTTPAVAAAATTTALASTSTSSLGSTSTVMPANVGASAGAGSAVAEGPSFVTTTTVTPVSSAVALAAQSTSTPNSTSNSTTSPSLSSFASPSSSLSPSSPVTSSFPSSSSTSPSTSSTLTSSINPWNHTQTYMHHQTILSLPNLTTFVGVYQQLAEMPSHTLEKIESVDLTCEPVYESRLGSVAGVLKKLKGLKTLDIWMHVPNGGGGGVLGGWGDMIGLGGFTNGSAGASASGVQLDGGVEPEDVDEDDTPTAVNAADGSNPAPTSSQDGLQQQHQVLFAPATATAGGDGGVNTTVGGGGGGGGNGTNAVAGPSSPTRRRRSQFVGSMLRGQLRNMSISTPSGSNGDGNAGHGATGGGNGGGGNGVNNGGGGGAGGVGGGNGGGGGGGGGHPEDRESEEDEGNRVFFKTILQSVPTLEELHFMCTTAFAVVAAYADDSEQKPLNQLASLLYLLPNLKVFSLTKGHKYRDETMLQSALRVLKVRPGLKQCPGSSGWGAPPVLGVVRSILVSGFGGFGFEIAWPVGVFGFRRCSGIGCFMATSSKTNCGLAVNVRWAREKSPNHLKQEGSYEVVGRRKVSIPSTSSSPSSSSQSSPKVNPRRASIASIASLKPTSSATTLTPNMSFKGKGKARDDSTSSSSSQLSLTTITPSPSSSTILPPGSPPKARLSPQQQQHQKNKDSRWEYEILEIQATERGIPLIGTPFLRKFKAELKVRVKKKHVISASMSSLSVPSTSMMSSSMSMPVGLGLSTLGQEEAENGSGTSTVTGLAPPIVLTTDVGGPPSGDDPSPETSPNVRRRSSLLQFSALKSLLGSSGGGSSSTSSATNSSRNRRRWSSAPRAISLEPTSNPDEERVQAQPSRSQASGGGDGGTDDVEHQASVRPRPGSSNQAPRPKSLDLGTLGVASQVIGEAPEDGEGEYNPWSSEDSQREVGKELYENSSYVWPADAHVGGDGSGLGVGLGSVGATAGASGRREPSTTSMPQLGAVDTNGVD